MIKDVFVIGCSIENHKQLSFLSQLIHNLTQRKKDFLLVSYNLLPESIVSKSKGFLYTQDNPRYIASDLENFPEQTYDTGQGFKITSPQILLGSIDYMGVSNLKLILNGLELARMCGYEAVHWIDYDALPNYAEIDQNIQLLEKNPMVYYGNTTHFSILLDSLKEEFYKFNDRSLLEKLKSHEYSLSRFVENELVYGQPYKKDGILVWEFIGKYDQLNERVKIHWSLFKKEGSENLSIFMLNTSEETIDVSFSHNRFCKTISLNSHTWLWEMIENSECPGIIEIIVPNQNHLKLDLTDPEIYKKMISSVKTYL